ncbi:MAG: hypothetical protein GFH27_549285n268 [Chloroflexi bacterium AL-W]|nr:hypothetical protein [Chloroflexi bacterium AL-N1]NOK65780.1 hypothetical protein [Chloroflexi bacterium AL-N10]NOK74279.1 hypothetical protein [Chloroflexi bacterium AL-N5]NOK80813.1 hypothetical protein [Chloroflexi bacterium AL-W]NOK88537.1 hypothetical protein [Chloroflexi bacterium AL-N15]
MLQVQQLHKTYGITTVLTDVTFILNDGEHIGLAGPNGVGKSTLLRCITGEEKPDSGLIACSPSNITLGYLPQSFDFTDTDTLDTVIAAVQSDFMAAETALQQSTEALSTAADVDSALQVYEEALMYFEALGGYEREQRVAEILEGLDLGHLTGSTCVATLSGGQKTRLGLATLLLHQSDILLLDEPTNHLDIEALDWLEHFIQRSPKTILVVSHDREFLDRTVSRILYLDPETRSVKSYLGNYSAFAAARDHEHELHVENWKRQQEYIGRTKQDIARLKGQALRVEGNTTPSQPNIRRLAKKVARKARSRERKLERYLESDERVEKPRQTWGLNLDFGTPPPGAQVVLHLEAVSFGYTQDAPLFQNISLDVEHRECIALVGPNGAGKTTLLRLIEGCFAPWEGQIRVGSNVRLGVLSQEHDILDQHSSVLDIVRNTRSMSETEARQFLHFFLFAGDSVFRSVTQCSLGERSRLQLALLVLQGCNVLLLDEPLNHLDIEGREHFEDALEAFEGTVIAVAHDRAFLRSFAERIIEIREGKARVFAGGFDDYVRHIQRT